MSGNAMWRLSAVLLVGAAGLATPGCGGSTSSSSAEVIDQKARADIKAINDYLGVSNGPSGTGPTSQLLPTLTDNFNFLRSVLNQMECEIETLKNGGVKPTPCPGGGGSSSPTVPPKYPA
jgi:hypothetical protein